MSTEHDQLLAIQTLGHLLDDLEHVRIANSNRIAASERDFGSSLPELDVIQAGLVKVEHEALLQLQRAWRKHPLAPWAKDIPGCGEKLISRLLTATGDPAERQNVAKLWAYCGHGNPNRKRSKGMTQEELFKAGNPEAKKRVWLLATQFVKTMNSPYRLVYEQARERYKDRLHERACVRCGPSGHPAAPGTPWNPGHQHAAALRYVGKIFLRDLWIEAKRLRAEEEPIDLPIAAG